MEKMSKQLDEILEVTEGILGKLKLLFWVEMEKKGIKKNCGSCESFGLVKGFCINEENHRIINRERDSRSKACKFWELKPTE